MNKKLVAAAIAATMAAPAAFAGNVTVYGKLHLSVDSVDVSGGYDGQGIVDRDSRIGFKGSEDLGNGLKAVWKTEWSIDLDGDSNTVSNNRNNYIGLAGSFGTFLLAGNINTPYKNSTGKMDFFGDQLADYNNTVGMEDLRADNAIVYMSPKFSGLKFSAAAIAGEANSATSGRTTSGDGLGDGYSMALNYNNAGIMAAAAYENMEDIAGTSAEDKWRVGLGYKMDAFKVAAVYESADYTGGNDADRWQLSAAYSIGNNTLKAMYGQEDRDTSGESDSWAIGVDHKLSKRTKAYVVYADSERGLRGQSDPGGYSGDASGFSLGMIHSF